MIYMTNHGGGCCGARHLHGFSDQENANVNLILARAAEVPLDRMTEVILNGRQVEAYPNILQTLANIGFVLDGHWKNGNHDSHNYRFSRCDNREALMTGPIAERWRGMVMSPGLTGRLPALDGQAGNRNTVHMPYVRPVPDWLVEESLARDRLFSIREYIGQRFRINSPHSRRNGMELICCGISDPYDGNRQATFRDNEGVRFSISIRNIVRVGELVNDNPRLRMFEVGDRIQVIRAWGPYPFGLCGTITEVRQREVSIQFDTPNTRVANSQFRFISIVDHERQPDVPRERIPPVEIKKDKNSYPWLHSDEGTPLPVIPVAIEVAPVTVFSTWHCVFGDGRRGAGYDTFQEAQATLGRRTRVDRRNILSNGNVEWIGNVAG